ncbi:20890_t:CDS:2 [Entrophospora sp. SA101]|nr:20890_t:CDS:2 [Entrophospora sp. SA101]
MPKKRKGHALKDITNELEHKKPKPNEALQLLLQLHPDLNSQKIYFFPCMNVHEEGILLYDQKDNFYYVNDILIIEWKDTILIHKIVIGKDFGMDKLTFQTIEEIENIIDNFFQMKIYEGFLTKAILENKDSSEECYQHINCKSIAHSSKQLLTEIILKQHNAYIEKEEAPISTEMSNLIENVSENVVNNQIDISNLNPILQKLIQIQCSNKEKMKYHPMFICWAISIYTRAGYTNIDSNYMPKEIIVLDPAENYKFEYISGWILYKLICVDAKINAHLKKDVLKKVLQSLFPEKGTASLRENLKMMCSKKTSLSTKPSLALNQLHIWAELEDAKFILLILFN